MKGSLRDLIQDALRNTEKLIGKGEWTADVSDQSKDEIRLYVETWILPNLKRALEKIKKKPSVKL